MCDNKYKMEQDLINKMHHIVNNKEKELCIIFKKDEQNSLYLSNLFNEGKQEEYKDDKGNLKYRAMCIFPSGMHPYLFHSHPIKSKSYPSNEDIIKLLRHDYIKISVIATRWGIYVIKPTDKSREFALHYSKLNRDDQYDEYKKIFGEYINKLVKIEIKKGYYKGVYTSVLDRDDLDYLYRQLNEISNITGLEIKFCTWRDLNIYR